MNAEPQAAKRSFGQPRLLPKTHVRASALGAAVRTRASTDSTQAPCWGNSLSWAETTPADEDGQNRRIGKKVNGVLVEGFLYRSQLKPAAWLDGTGAVKATFVYSDSPNVPEYMAQGTTTYRLITDQVGSVRLVQNTSTGTVAERIDYDEFGNVLADSAPGFQPFGFAGGLRDLDTGLTRFGARDYDPVTGRWTAKDPLKFGGGLANLYSYVDGDPVNDSDPDGLVTYKCTKPLDALGGKNAPKSNRRTGPDFWGNPLYHQFLCVQEKGKAPVCGGLTQANGNPFGPGAKSKDVFIPGRCDVASDDNACLESCLLKKFDGPRPWYGVTGVGTNCQQWADEAFNSCSRQCSGGSK